MIRIAITPAAFDAIVATLPGKVGYENARAPNGDFYVWLPHDVLAKLNHLPETGESYSDTVLRVGAAEAGAER